MSKKNDKVILFWKRHRRLFVTAILIYELVFGILIWYLLNLSQDMYELGAKDCYDWMKRMNEMAGIQNITKFNVTFNFSTSIPTISVP